VLRRPSDNMRYPRQHFFRMSRLSPYQDPQYRFIMTRGSVRNKEAWASAIVIMSRIILPLGYPGLPPARSPRRP
jgi:hypothetical protein